MPPPRKAVASLDRALSLAADEPWLAGEKGLIEDMNAWFDDRDMRDRSSHTYDEVRAKALLAGIPRFLADARVPLSRLDGPDA